MSLYISIKKNIKFHEEYLEKYDLENIFKDQELSEKFIEKYKDKNWRHIFIF